SLRRNEAARARHPEQLVRGEEVNEPRCLTATVKIGIGANDAPPQKNLKRKRTIATTAKAAAISPPTTQKPFGLPLNGMPLTFMPQCPRSALPAGESPRTS